MGKKPDEIQREIEAYREGITRRVSELDQRVRTDVGDVKSRFGEEAGKVKDNARQGFGIDEKVREHPLTYIAGAFGTGVVLGLASESGGAVGRQTSRVVGGGTGLLGSLLGNVAGPATTALQEEMEQLVRRTFQGFGEGQKEKSEATHF